MFLCKVLVRRVVGIIKRDLFLQFSTTCRAVRSTNIVNPEKSPRRSLFMSLHVSPTQNVSATILYRLRSLHAGGLITCISTLACLRSANFSFVYDFEWLLCILALSPLLDSRRGCYYSSNDGRREHRHTRERHESVACVNEVLAMFILSIHQIAVKLFTFWSHISS